MVQKRNAFVAMVLSGVLLSACGGGGSSAGTAGNPSGDTPSTYTLGGSINGLSASGLVLANGGATVSPAATAGTFTFSAALTAGTSYDVTVQTQPAGETCTVASGGGTIGTSAVTSVSVTCQPQEFAYAGGSGIYGYSIDLGSGALTGMSVSPLANVAVSGNLTVDPAGHFLFAMEGGDIAVYSINASTGALSSVTGSPFSAGGQADFTTIDPTGRFLYVSAVDSHVWAYTIDGTTGVLTPVTGSPFAAGAYPKGVTVDSTGKFAYVVNSNSDTVSAYAIDQTSGALTPVPGSPFSIGSGSGDCFVASDPHSDFIYVYDVTNANATISPYAIDVSTGALSPNSGGSVNFGGPVSGGIVAAGGPFCGTIAVNSSGMSMYATDPNHGQIWAFSVNLTTGALAAGTGAPATTPNGTAVDPSGQFLYVTAGNAVAGFPINASTGEIPIAPSTDVSAPGSNAVVVAQPKP